MRKILILSVGKIDYAVLDLPTDEKLWVTADTNCKTKRGLSI